MSDDGLHQRHLSRRELIRIAGLSGLAVAGAGWAGPRILTVPLAEAAEGTPEAFLATLFAQRAQAMTTGDANPLAALYDPTNARLHSSNKNARNSSRMTLPPAGAIAPCLTTGAPQADRAGGDGLHRRGADRRGILHGLAPAP